MFCHSRRKVSTTHSVLNFLRFIECYVHVFPVCMYMCHMSSWCPWRSEESTGSPGSGIRMGGLCDTLHGSSHRPGTLVSHHLYTENQAWSSEIAGALKH